MIRAAFFGYREEGTGWVPVVTLQKNLSCVLSVLGTRKAVVALSLLPTSCPVAVGRSSVCLCLEALVFGRFWGSQEFAKCQVLEQTAGSGMHSKRLLLAVVSNVEGLWQCSL